MNTSNLVDQDQFLQLIMDNIPQFIFWKDRDSVYLGCNQNFATAAGFSKSSEIIGKTDYDLPWSKEEADFYIKMDQKVMLSDQSEVNFEEPQTMSDGITKWIRTSKIPLKGPDGDVIGILGTYEDITQRKEIELKLEESSEALLIANQNMKKAILDLERANMDLEQFAYATSHDLEEPLGTIRNFLPLVERELNGKKSKELTKYINFIDTSVGKMSKLTAGILTHLRLSHTAQVMEEIKIDDILAKTLEKIKGTYPEKNSVFINNLQDQIITCYPKQIEVLFYNLILNGIKFNKNKPKITINLQEKTQEWLFSIADNGIGIEEQFDELVYKPFKKLNTSRDFSGAGLGLSMCKRIAVLHAGKIWHETNDIGGTTFYFTIQK